MVVHQGELLQGTLDKATYGTHGLVHAVQVRLLGCFVLLVFQYSTCTGKSSAFDMPQEVGNSSF